MYLLDDSEPSTRPQIFGIPSFCPCTVFISLTYQLLNTWYEDVGMLYLEMAPTAVAIYNILPKFSQVRQRTANRSSNVYSGLLKNRPDIYSHPTLVYFMALSINNA